MSRKKRVSFNYYDKDDEKHHEQGLKMCKDFWRERESQLPFLQSVDMEQMYNKLEDVTQMFVLEDRKGNIVAMSGIMDMPVSIGSAALGSVCVAPNDRGKGFGAQMVDEAEKMIRQKFQYFRVPNCSIYLSCFEDTLAFWEKMGYRVLERRLHDILMTKTLW